MAVTRLAAIEIGSHELVLEVFDVSAGKEIRLIDQVRHAVALGKDTYANGRISYPILDEVCNVLSSFVEIIHAYKTDDYQAVATSAIREADNNTIVLDQIRVRTGLKVTVLSNSEQRYVSYKAVAAHKNDFNRLIEQGSAFVEIGSGSLQISLFDKKSLLTTQNLKLGAMRIREMLADIEDERAFSNIVTELIDNDMERFKKMFLKDYETKNVICMGTVLAFFMKKMSNKNLEWMKVEHFNEIYDMVTNSSPEMLADNYNMPAESTQLLLPTIMILKKVIDTSAAEMVWIPNISLCDGVAADMADKKKIVRLEHNFAGDILAAARNISKRYMGDKSHSAVLENNVTKIFDSIKKYHGMEKRERLLLQIAALLHDCGKYISMSFPGECAYNIIMFTEIIGLSHSEREMVANIVKFNTVEMPSYERFSGKLTEEQYLKVMKLTAILQVGNALDRSHKQKFKNIKTSVRNGVLVITTETIEDISLERMLFEKKADFFEEIFSIRPILKQRREVY